MFFTPVIRRSAFNPSLRSLERFFEESRPARASVATANNCRVQQDDKTYTLSLDLPGIVKEQLSIGIEGSIVRLESKAGAPRRYQAVYELPQDIDVGASDARLENGVLTLKLAKKVAARNVSHLTIN